MLQICSLHSAAAPRKLYKKVGWNRRGRRWMNQIYRLIWARRLSAGKLSQKIITDDITKLVILESQRVRQVLVGPGSFISLGPPGCLQPKSGHRSVHKRCCLMPLFYIFSIIFAKCHLYCFNEEKTLEGGRTARCPIKNKIAGFRE